MRDCNGKPTLYKRTFDSPESVEWETIDLGKAKIDWFNVQFNSKFVLISRTEEGVDKVYCNSQKLCEIPYLQKDSEYSIIYDHTTRLWLVISTDGLGIVIKQDGSFDEINISEYANSNNLLNVYFASGMIYIPQKDQLVIAKIPDTSKAKTLQCPKIMTSNSRLYDVNSKGFGFITDNALYKVRKG